MRLYNCHNKIDMNNTKIEKESMISFIMSLLSMVSYPIPPKILKKK